jgi:hypothetical protein
MLRKITIALVGLVVIIAVGGGMEGCGQSLQKPPANYFPHNDGYSWTYVCKQTMGTSEISWTRTYHFEGITSLSDSRTVQKLMISEEAGSKSVKSHSFASSSGYYQIDDSGIYYYGSISHPTTEAILILPFPLEVGKTWQRGALGTFEVFGVETVETPLGSYQAIKVGQQENDFEMYEWYADGVGMVKSYMKIPVISEIGRDLETIAIIIEELVSKNF